MAVDQNLSRVVRAADATVVGREMRRDTVYGTGVQEGLKRLLLRVQQQSVHVEHDRSRYIHVRPRRSAGKRLLDERRLPLPVQVLIEPDGFQLQFVVALQQSRIDSQPIAEGQEHLESGSVCHDLDRNVRTVLDCLKHAERLGSQGSRLFSKTQAVQASYGLLDLISWHADKNVEVALRHGSRYGRRADVLDAGVRQADTNLRGDRAKKLQGFGLVLFRLQEFHFQVRRHHGRR